MNEDDYEQLAHVLKLVRCKDLQLVNCCLTKTKLRGLFRGCNTQNFQVRYCGITVKISEYMALIKLFFELALKFSIPLIPVLKNIGTRLYY